MLDGRRGEMEGKKTKMGRNDVAKRGEALKRGGIENGRRNKKTAAPERCSRSLKFLQRNIRISLQKKQSASCVRDDDEQPVRDVH